tara:strand:+ start:209 stop:562 length:354 start_codon:yes stop_codon:yes gene_type:complete
MNELKLEYVIIIFLVIIAIVILFYKNLDTPQPQLPSHPQKEIKPILKKVVKEKTNNNVKFYDVRMSKQSNDIDVTKNQQPTDELLAVYQPASETVPTDNIICDGKGKLQNKPLRFNI